jgi:predicted ATPase
VASAIAESFDLVDVTPLDLPRRARAACQDRPTLLILDNCEHVLDDAPLVAELLATVPSLRVLATSRAPLRLRGEREYVVGPLDLAAGAVQLFAERVRDVRPDFRVTPANEGTITAICRRLDALPLALELAARWMKVLTAEALLRRLEGDVLLSTAGLRDLPARQQTMNATVAWSYQLLDPEEQRAFRRFGAVPGRFSLAAAAEVLDGDDALPAAAALIDKSLLCRDARDERRYYMLETVRAYAALELESAGERDEATEGLVRYCQREAALADEGLMGTAQAEWVDRIQDDIESYRHVLTWLLARDRAVDAAAIAWSLLLFWVIRGQVEGGRWYDQILQASSLPPLVEARVLICVASIGFNQGDLDRARTALARAIPLARAADGRLELARIDDLSARVEHAIGNVEAARGLFARAITAFDRLSLSVVVGHTLVGMARGALALGEIGLAERLLDEATPKLREAGAWFVSRALYVRALLAIQRGDAHRAIALTHESLTLSRRLDDKYALAFTLVPLASAAVLAGDDEWAARLIGAREAISERTGTTIGLKVVHDLHEQAERQARTRLGADRWQQAYAAGRAASGESLLEDLESRI